jgi:hypothetical protein
MYPATSVQEKQIDSSLEAEPIACIDEAGRVRSVDSSIA